MLESKGFLLGSSTHDNDMLTTIAGLVHFLKGLKPKNRIGAVFGSYGWGGGAVTNLEKSLTEMGVNLVQPNLSLKYTPSKEELTQCYEYGKNFGSKITETGA